MRIQIIGFGLAGSWIAWELRKRGITVVVNDRYNPDSSSRIAAGLINPINGVRPRPSWNLETLLPLAQRAYTELSDAVGQTLLSPIRIRRVFRTEDDFALWNTAVAKTWYDNSSEGFAVSWQYVDADTFDGVEYVFGGVQYDGAAVNTIETIDSIKNLIEFVDTPDPHVDYTIWCEGWSAATNHLWSWLPFQPVKGEILDAQIDGPPLTTIITRGIWIVPNDDVPGVIRIGSTYDWDDLTDTPTEHARHVLRTSAETILGRSIVVTGQRAAVRPAAQSKRPYVGIHPLQRKHAILNGLGTKGALWAPWAAHQLANHIIDGAPLHPEIDIMRWWK